MGFRALNQIRPRSGKREKGVLARIIKNKGLEEEIKIEPIWVAGSERPQDQVVEAGQEDVVPHHEE